jgi:Fe-Mn family superoxide dismutase
MSKYVLPELTYDYAALEPSISARIMELHHSKHHAAYVAGANATLDLLEEARAKNDFTWVNHSIFWNNLAPANSDRPSGELAAAINEFFGSFEAFQAHFNASAMGIQGSGWSFLAWDSLGKRLIIEQLYDQQGNIVAGSVPLLMLDMWEHAFYLDYVNVKGDYVKAFWNIINWADVEARFAAARA